jgi:diadenosine tetraphosphate (Ap4A) HIT family hydrolase
MSCAFCKKSNNDIDFLLENKSWIATLADEQSYLGRSIVVLKRHAGDLAELTSEEWVDFQDMIMKLELAFRKAFNATMFNWTCLVNNSYREKPYDPHLHWHLRPRYDHEVNFDGITFTDPEFGKHYTLVRRVELPDQNVSNIAERVRGSI